MVFSLHQSFSERKPTEAPMPITIQAGPDKQINVSDLQDLENRVLTVFNVGKDLAVYFDQPVSEFPETVTGSVQYDSGNQNWSVNAVAFKLSGGVTGKIEVVKSGKLYDYTDSFPTEVQLGLSTPDNSKASTSFTVNGEAVYVGIELDFCIGAGVSLTSAATSFGLSASASASTSDTFTVAFYKKCAPSDILSAAIGQAFKDLVLPFHPETIRNLPVGDILRHTAGANLQLGLGVGIGFDSFSVASQWEKGIPGLANSPKLNLGLNPTVTPSANLAYSFGYAGTFEQTLWRESETSARLHLYKSTQKTQGLEFTAGITLDVNLSAAVEVQKQILQAPANATSDPDLQKALNTAFNAASGEIGKLAKDLNSKISKLLSPIDQDLTVELDAKITSTNQSFLLTDYTIDLTKNYAAAWSDMVNGRFLDALADREGSVQLATGSGLEKLYNRTASISLNFFGQAAAAWATSSIENSRLLYAGNNLFHLITADGMQQISQFGDSSSEIDFYFSVEMDLSAGGGSGDAKPELHVVLKADHNPAFGARIATAVGWLTSGPASQDLRNQILQSANTADSTQVLHVVIPQSAYAELAFSQPGSSDISADEKNYGAFELASKITMPDGTPSQFVHGNKEFTYDFWSAWNIALTDEWPAPEGSHPNRKGSGTFQGAYVKTFVDERFSDADSGLVLSIGYTLQAASEFMNLCEDLKHLCADDVIDINTWNDFAARLNKIARKDVNFDFMVPTVLALTQLCGSGMPGLTVGPAPGLSAETSIGVVMMLSDGAIAAPHLEKETAAAI
jgi:hypothetical protein